MATQVKMECAVWRDTLEARDAMIITPHFKVVGGSPDIQGLADDLATSIDTWQGNRGQVRVRAYDDEGTPPRAPLAESFKGKGLAPSATVNRDIALVLSFHGGSGRPTERGRLYAALAVINVNSSSAVATATIMNRVAELVPILTGLGGINVDWVVWSQKMRSSVPVTDWHVDNAFDTQRRRGMPGTARISGTTTEDQAPSFTLIGPSIDPELVALAGGAGGEG